MKEFLLKFLQERWAIVCLFILFVFLICAHAFMIHFNRAESQIQWAENMITGVFTAMIAKFKD